jgi:hypothetical protein
MNPYDIRMRCLEAAKPVTGDPFAALRIAFAYECFVQLGFDHGMRTLTNPPSPREPAPAAQAAVSETSDDEDRPATQDGFPVDRLH